MIKEGSKMMKRSKPKDGYIDFKTKEDYNKWLAYGHIHHVFKGKQPVRVAGKVVKVKHGRC